MPDNNIHMIYLRNEINTNELRTPIIPNDIPKLLNMGFVVYVESSCHRIYTDSEYTACGAIVTNDKWYNEKFTKAMIVGLKELENMDRLNKHTHMYFAHCYKNQAGSRGILKQFARSGSYLYDFEYFLEPNTNNTDRYASFTPLNLRATLPINELHLCTFKTPTSWAVMSERGDADCAFSRRERNGVKGNPPMEGCPILNLHRCKRIISFGFYAGMVGCVLGLEQYLCKQQTATNVSNLQCWESKEHMMKNINYYLIKNQQAFANLNIAIIGAKGNCGTGVKNILRHLIMLYKIKIKRDENPDKSCLHKYDIVFNCINLKETCEEVWFSPETRFEKPIVIVDISCDYSKSNNPIAIYTEPTTWVEPVYSYNSYVDIIAINNLPSLLPRDSSNYFSGKCVELAKQYTPLNGTHSSVQQDVHDSVWKRNRQIFLSQIYEKCFI